MNFLLARATGVSGEIEVAIGALTGPVQILYGVNVPGQTVEWIVGPMLDPGHSANIQFLQNDVIYEIMAFGVEAHEIAFTSVVPFNAVSPYSITVAHDPIETYLVDGKEAFRLRGRVVSAAGMPTKVFLYRYEVATSTEQVPSRLAFLTVCSASDLAQYPEDAPADGQELPFFRLDYVDIVEDRLDAVEYFWDSVASAVLALQQELEDTRLIRDTTLVSMHTGVGPEPSLSSTSQWPVYSSSSSSSSMISSSL